MIKYSLRVVGLVGAVSVVEVVLLCQVPVVCVPLYKTRDDDKAQNHQVDASEDLIHQR